MERKERRRQRRAKTTGMITGKVKDIYTRSLCSSACVILSLVCFVWE